MTEYCGWIRILFEEDSRIKEIRDQLFNKLEYSGYNKEQQPHLTFHPGFQIPADKKHVLKEKFEELNLAQKSYYSTGIYGYPRSSDPMVVCLDIETDLHTERSIFRKEVKKHNGIHIYTPTRPHITLFKIDNVDKTSSMNNISKEDIQLLKNAENYVDTSFYLNPKEVKFVEMGE